MGLSPESSQRETDKGNRTWIVIEAVGRSVPGAIAEENSKNRAYLGWRDTISTELARFGAAIMTCQESKWFRKIIKKWEFWENGKLEEDILKTTEEEEKKRGRKLYE